MKRFIFIISFAFICLAACSSETVNFLTNAQEFEEDTPVTALYDDKEAFTIEVNEAWAIDESQYESLKPKYDGKIKSGSALVAVKYKIVNLDSAKEIWSEKYASLSAVDGKGGNLLYTNSHFSSTVNSFDEITSGNFNLETSLSNLTYVALFKLDKPADEVYFGFKLNSGSGGSNGYVKLPVGEPRESLGELGIKNITGSTMVSEVKLGNFMFVQNAGFKIEPSYQDTDLYKSLSAYEFNNNITCIVEVDGRKKIEDISDYVVQYIIDEIGDGTEQINQTSKFAGTSELEVNSKTWIEVKSKSVQTDMVFIYRHLFALDDGFLYHIKFSFPEDKQDAAEEKINEMVNSFTIE